MENKPFTISAFPRSGTRYVATILLKHGIPCTHEGYHPQHLKIMPPLTHNLVSSVVTDWAKEWRYEHTTNLYLVRNPYEVIKSWTTLRPQHRAALYNWYKTQGFEETWVASVEFGEKLAKAIIKVEEFESAWEDVIAYLGYPEVRLKYSPRNRINSNIENERYGRIEIDETPEFLTLVEKYGYNR